MSSDDQLTSASSDRSLEADILESCRRRAGQWTCFRTFQAIPADQPATLQFYGEHAGSSPPSALPCFLADIMRSPRPLLLPSTGEVDIFDMSFRPADRLFLSQVQHATSGPFVALALHGPDAIKHWRSLIGPTHVYKGQWNDPETLRARYGLSDTRNGFHGSSALALQRERRAERWVLQVRTRQSRQEKNSRRSSKGGT
jgi:nucleoside diphosphate kinase